MPLDVTLDATGRFSVLAVTDPYTMEEWQSTALRFIDSPEFLRHGALLVDRRACAPPTTAHVDWMTRVFADHRQLLAGRRAAIVVANDTSFGMGRMTVLKCESAIPGANMRVFRNYDAAVQWLTGRE